MSLFVLLNFLDVVEEIQEALGNISEGVVSPLRMRIEQIITSEIPHKTLYTITNLLCFYGQTFTQVSFFHVSLFTN